MKTHWSLSSNNPNDLTLREARAVRIKGALLETPVDRVGFIKNIVSGKDVLDVGCVSHFSESESHEEWLHRQISDAAKMCLGIDILEEDLKLLSKRGYNVRVHDLTSVPLEERFDVIVCGELVEHLGAVDSFFRNCHHCLADNGVVVMTTPYPWFTGTVLRALFSGAPLPGSLDHVAWYEPSCVMELADRYGFSLDAIVGLNPGSDQRHGGGMELIYSLVRKGWLPFLSRLIGCRSVLYKLRKI